MTNGFKMRLGAISLVLAFAVQALTVTWFLSDMWHRVDRIGEANAAHRITIIEQQLIWYAAQLEEAKRDIRDLQRR